MGGAQNQKENELSLDRKYDDSDDAALFDNESDLQNSEIDCGEGEGGIIINEIEGEDQEMVIAQISTKIDQILDKSQQRQKKKIDLEERKRVRKLKLE